MLSAKHMNKYLVSTEAVINVNAQSINVDSITIKKNNFSKLRSYLH
jgi:hypothetical protein